MTSRTGQEVAEDLQEQIELQNAIYRQLIENPRWVRFLRRMVKWEQDNLDTGSPYWGWEWDEVNVPTGAINAMIGMDFVQRTFKSRSRRTYRLRSLEATEQAIEALAMPLVEGEPLEVDDLFSLVVGHHKVKQLLRFSVLADDPVHCLLIGPPGVAKSLMLSDIGALKGAEFYAGSTTTRAGLVGLLLGNRPRFLVIDELDKMATVDTTPLLNLMETGMVTRLQHRRQDRVKMETKVFAGANDLRTIERRMPALLSRFAKFVIPPYTKPQFIQVASRVLEEREGMGPEMAKNIAYEVVEHSTDIRDAVRVARMSRGDPRLVVDVVSCLWSR